MEKENIFIEPKVLKNWAIKLANELGGQRVEKTATLNPMRLNKVTKLIDQFVIDHNTNMTKVLNEEEE